MTWAERRTRMREWWGNIRARVTRRHVLAVIGTSMALGSTVITIEALVRARLTSPLARVPTTLYTRSVPWSPDRDAETDSITPIAIGTLDGAAPEWRIPVQLDQVPRNVVQAIVAVEDQRFFHHHGLDIKRIGGALIADLRTHGFNQGGSTLTQQLAKNLFLSADRTPLRKLREAAMALVLEARYSKAQILDAYLNEIYLGQDGVRAIHGVGAASRYYFGKDIRRVTLAEAAQLAGMISAPNRNAATRHADAAHDRRDMVLELMVQQHRITEAAGTRAEAAPITTLPHGAPALDSRYFRDFVASVLPKGLPARGIAVYTTLDPALQRAAERAIARAPVRSAEAALVAIDPRTGDVLAMVGGRDYRASQFNRAVDAHRQPGSAFKPIVALAALAPYRGQSPQYTLASNLEDTPLSVRTPSGPWQPTDYDHDFRGDVSFREAMEQSLNVPFARVGLAVGEQRVVDVAHQLGITSALTPVPSLALGSSEVSLLELTRAYGVFAASGRLAPTRSVLAYGRSGATLVVDAGGDAPQVIDPAVAYLVTSSLEGVVTRGTGRALDQDEHLGGVAGKTGTSSDWRDAWFITYTPSLVVGVWTGYDDGRSLRLTGAAAALPIAASFLAQVTPDGGWDQFPVPDGITEAYVGGSDGDLPDCGSREEVFLDGTAPASEDCQPFATPAWHGAQELEVQLERRAAHLLQQFLQRLHRHRVALGVEQ